LWTLPTHGHSLPGIGAISVRTAAVERSAAFLAKTAPRWVMTIFPLFFPVSLPFTPSQSQDFLLSCETLLLLGSLLSAHQGQGAQVGLELGDLETVTMCTCGSTCYTLCLCLPSSLHNQELQPGLNVGWKAIECKFSRETRDRKLLNQV